MKKGLLVLWFMALTIIFTASGCTDAKRAEMLRFGDSAHVTAITSFGKELYSGTSTGKLNKKEGGYLFVEEGSGDTIQILGQNIAFVIRYKD